ncbi:PPP1R12B [Symbiodinium pilosum]|uniref:PPP1R12B protein n=1 Tax=Symbiodinium pilosum TaxID=2952 RepID=A0A812LI29_SYMPI|nr:PPP1R12B [Symbiodinium pilosum]
MPWIIDSVVCSFRRLRALRREAPLFSSSRELSGPALWNHLLAVDVLHELLFSTIMLHWNRYAPLPASERVLLQDWVDMHRVGGNQIVPAVVLTPIFEMVSNWSWEPLHIGTPSPDANSNEDLHTLFDGLASVEGWAYTLGNDFLTHVDETAHGIMEQEHIHKALGYVCEGTFSARDPIGQSAVAAPISHAVKAVCAQDAEGMNFSSDVWISLCGPLLFLAFDQVTCPFAFVYTGDAQLADVNPGRALFSLEALPRRDDQASRLEIILLLPDGRWHICSLQKLVLQLADPRHLKDWMTCFADLALKGAGGNSLKHI